jgi:hypothetical protein
MKDICAEKLDVSPVLHMPGISSHEHLAGIGLDATSAQQQSHGADKTSVQTRVV